MGTWQQDAIRNIVGKFHAVLRNLFYNGAFYDTGERLNGSDTGGNLTPVIGFDASRSVPTASENRPRNFPVYYGIRY